MKFDILIGADEFWQSLERDIVGAKQKVCIQAMTFEADAVGHKVFDTLKASPAKRKHLCVDNFSNLIISDQFVYGPHRLVSRDFRKEIRDTKHMFKTADVHNIGVFFTNPMGLLYTKYPHRNHKKLMLIDDHVSYVGGMNFSEHNFAWHDMMLRIDDKEIAAFFARDFENTINGRNQSKRTVIGGADIFILDGFKSRQMYEELFAIIAEAKKSIRVVSPYITSPFLEVIGERAKEGVDVSIISPSANNKKLLKYYLQYQQSKYPFSILMYEKKMSHLKAILIDDKTLIMGSTNFDFASYYLEQEYCVVIRDDALVHTFKERVLDDAVRHSVLYTPTSPSLKHVLANMAITVAMWFCGHLARIIYRSSD